MRFNPALDLSSPIRVKAEEMPQKHKSKSWAELKQAGNDCFKTGQYGEATNQYHQAIKELEKSSRSS